MRARLIGLTTVRRSGNSLAILVPRRAREALGLKPGDDLEVYIIRLNDETALLYRRVKPMALPGGSPRGQGEAHLSGRPGGVPGAYREEAVKDEEAG